MTVKTLYFDESGFTGYNLLDPTGLDDFIDLALTRRDYYFPATILTPTSRT
jgi:hypothetical protein